MRKISSRLRFAGEVLVKAGPALARDFVGFAGVVVIVNGVHLIYEPAGWIAGGLALIFAAAVMSRKPAA